MPIWPELMRWDYPLSVDRPTIASCGAGTNPDLRRYMGHTYRSRLNTAYSILDECRVTLCPARVRSYIAGVTCPFVVSGRSQSTGSPGQASVAVARRPDHLPLSVQTERGPRRPDVAARRKHRQVDATGAINVRSKYCYRYSY